MRAEPGDHERSGLAADEARTDRVLQHGLARHPIHVVPRLVGRCLPRHLLPRSLRLGAAAALGPTVVLTTDTVQRTWVVEQRRHSRPPVITVRRGVVDGSVLRRVEILAQQVVQSDRDHPSRAVLYVQTALDREAHPVFGGVPDQRADLGQRSKRRVAVDLQPLGLRGSRGLQHSLDLRRLAHQQPPAFPVLGVVQDVAQPHALPLDLGANRDAVLVLIGDLPAPTETAGQGPRRAVSGPHVVDIGQALRQCVADELEHASAGAARQVGVGGRDAGVVHGHVDAPQELVALCVCDCAQVDEAVCDGDPAGPGLGESSGLPNGLPRRRELVGVGLRDRPVRGPMPV